ncbi:hypothetical protein niasHT_015902 [Heterodera trifolii]|uniref:Thrombospondin type 1 domain protein n=1 Tax=Heterodera trifolii TaxID=157864 RepID=A0ABD2LK70_9BILA
MAPFRHFFLLPVYWPINFHFLFHFLFHLPFLAFFVLMLLNSRSVFGQTPAAAQCQSVGQWADWGQWQPCPQNPSRSELNVQRRTRLCQPLPIGCIPSRTAPFYCPGTYSEVLPCVVTTTVTVPVITSTQRMTTTAPPNNTCAQWNSWMEWSVCTDTCGGCGTQQRFRSCNHFVANCPCPGSAFEKVNCNMAVCVYPRGPTCCGNFTPATVNNQFQCV